MELLVKIGNNTNPDPTKDRVGCYKHGDIIHVAPDGEYADKPWCNVIKIPGLDHKKFRFLLESRKEPVLDESVVIRLTDEEYQSTKGIVLNTEVCNKPYTLKLNQFIDAPTIVKSEVSKDGKTYHTITGTVLKTFEKRRFRIPAILMATLFPKGTGQVTVNSDNFNAQLLDEMLDKSFSNAKVKDTIWRQNSSVLSIKVAKITVRSLLGKLLRNVI